MSTSNQSLTERIAARLDAFNQRLEARLRRSELDKTASIAYNGGE